MTTLRGFKKWLGDKVEDNVKKKKESRKTEDVWKDVLHHIPSAEIAEGAYNAFINDENADLFIAVFKDVDRHWVFVSSKENAQKIKIEDWTMTTMIKPEWLKLKKSIDKKDVVISTGKLFYECLIGGLFFHTKAEGFNALENNDKIEFLREKFEILGCSLSGITKFDERGGVLMDQQDYIVEEKEEEEELYIYTTENLREYVGTGLRRIWIYCEDEDINRIWEWIYTDNIGFLADKTLLIRVPIECKYLFSWNSVLGGDYEEFKESLRDDFDIGWTEIAEILKLDDGKTISIFKDENSAKIIIDETKKEASLKISDGRTHDLKVKKENSKLNIYDCKFNGKVNKEDEDESAETLKFAVLVEEDSSQSYAASTFIKSFCEYYQKYTHQKIHIGNLMELKKTITCNCIHASLTKPKNEKHYKPILLAAARAAKAKLKANGQKKHPCFLFLKMCESETRAQILKIVSPVVWIETSFDVTDDSFEKEFYRAFCNTGDISEAIIKARNKIPNSSLRFAYVLKGNPLILREF